MGAGSSGARAAGGVTRRAFRGGTTPIREITPEGRLGNAVWFTPDRSTARAYARGAGPGARVEAADLNLSRPLQVNAAGMPADDIPYYTLPPRVRAHFEEGAGGITTDRVAEAARAEGYDSVILFNIKNSPETGSVRGTSIAVFDPASIAAIESKGWRRFTPFAAGAAGTGAALAIPGEAEGLSSQHLDQRIDSLFPPEDRTPRERVADTIRDVSGVVRTPSMAVAPLVADAIEAPVDTAAEFTVGASARSGADRIRRGQALSLDPSVEPDYFSDYGPRPNPEYRAPFFEDPDNLYQERFDANGGRQPIDEAIDAVFAPLEATGIMSGARSVARRAATPSLEARTTVAGARGRRVRDSISPPRGTQPGEAVPYPADGNPRQIQRYNQARDRNLLSTEINRPAINPHEIDRQIDEILQGGENRHSSYHQRGSSRPERLNQPLNSTIEDAARLTPDEQRLLNRSRPMERMVAPAAGAVGVTGALLGIMDYLTPEPEEPPERPSNARTVGLSEAPPGLYDDLWIMDQDEHARMAGEAAERNRRNEPTPDPRQGIPFEFRAEPPTISADMPARHLVDDRKPPESWVPPDVDAPAQEQRLGEPSEMLNEGLPPLAASVNRGASVRELQEIAKLRFGQNLAVDDIWGPETRRIVGGVLGREISENPTPQERQALSRAMLAKPLETPTARSVTYDIQSALLANGFDIGEERADGYLGPKTAAALQDFLYRRGADVTIESGERRVPVLLDVWERYFIGEDASQPRASGSGAR